MSLPVSSKHMQLVGNRFSFRISESGHKKGEMIQVGFVLPTYPAIYIRFYSVFMDSSNS